ncbi:MAG TPA: hypothetical protein VHW92_12990 [Mycobacteriales bacterium]|nr:hypothetical protein [Mycobacteriales bacterium]
MPRAAAKPASPAVKATPRVSVRERAGAALLESSVVESALDRILVKRLRPLKAEATATRKAYELQVTLRVEAEARATRLEQEARALRVQVQSLEDELVLAQQRRAGWFRRRAVSPSPRAQEA